MISEFLPDGLVRRGDAIGYHNQIAPNAYLVIHLQPHLTDPDYGVTYATTDIYDRQAYKFVASVSRQVLGKSAYRNRPKHRKRLPNMVTLEGVESCPHLNICIRRPEGFSWDRFLEICDQEYRRMKWFRHSACSFFCEPAYGGCGIYSLKEGATILPRSLCFHR